MLNTKTTWRRADGAIITKFTDLGATDGEWPEVRHACGGRVDTAAIGTSEYETCRRCGEHAQVLRSTPGNGPRPYQKAEERKAHINARNRNEGT